MTINIETFPGFPAGNPFPESTVDSRGIGSPDFPSHAGTAEHARLRPSKTPGLNQVAVTNDDGSEVGSGNLSAIEETLLELKAIRLGIQFMLAEFNASWAGHDLREIAASE